MWVTIRATVFGLGVTCLLSAATIGQTDTFEDGTVMGWFVPGLSPVPPSNVSTGGPAGVGDAYLLLMAIGGAGAGSRLSALNDSQWAGNYVAAGVTLIRMNVYNFGPDDLYLRLLFEDFDGAGPPVNLALSATPVFVPAGSGWMTVEFPIAPGNLIVDTFGSAIGALTSTDTLRIFHNPDPTFPGPGVGIPAVIVSLGVDNITAVGVAEIPEPGALSLLTGGLLALLLRRCVGANPRLTPRA